MNIRKYLILMFTLIIIPATVGCWDQRELSELALATCVGIDKGDDPTPIQMTVELVLPKTFHPGRRWRPGQTNFYYQI